MAENCPRCGKRYKSWEVGEIDFCDDCKYILEEQGKIKFINTRSKNNKDIADDPHEKDITIRMYSRKMLTSVYWFFGGIILSVIVGILTKNYKNGLYILLAPGSTIHGLSRFLYNLFYWLKYKYDMF